MIKVLFRLPKKEEDWRNFELARIAERDRWLSRAPLPEFDLGLEYLVDSSSGEKSEAGRELAGALADNWFQEPERFLKLSGTSTVREEDGFLAFPSLLDSRQTARFRYHPQRAGTPGRRVALIHVMHWNGRLGFYERGINFIRTTFLPITTLIHIPAGRDLNPGETGNRFDYEAVGPNIGLTIFKTRQDVHDLQFVARYLKEELGYEEVGLFSYSLGSLRAVLAAIMSPELFDFAVFHLVADNFRDAVMEGLATVQIAGKIRPQMEDTTLRLLWSTISPGAYADYFGKLPRAVRLVQARHDYVFGPENIRRFNEKIVKARLDAELIETDLCHNALDTFPRGWKIMIDDIGFIYRNSAMRECKRSFPFRFLY